MKKQFFFTLFVVFALMLAACGGSNTNDNANMGNNEGEVAENNEPTDEEENTNEEENESNEENEDEGEDDEEENEPQFSVDSNLDEPIVVLTEENYVYLEIPEASSHIYVFETSTEYDDVRIEANVALVGGPNETVIILTCRTDDNGQDGYFFAYQPGGLWYIVYVSPDGEADFLKNGGTFVLNLGEAENTFSATCEGEDLIFGINGEEIARTTDSRATDGLVGFGIETVDIPGSQVEFRNLSVDTP